MQADEMQSKTIDYLRFPLIIGVILIHSYSNSITLNGVSVLFIDHFPINYIIQSLFSKVMGMFCVPIFFFMSGFLFFLNCEIDLPTYRKKINNRIRTLFIPYVFWNLLVLLIYFIAQTIPQISPYVNQPIIRNYSFIDYLNAFGGFDDGKPIAFQFWFIRDLFMVSLLTPLLKLLLSYFKYYGLIVVGTIWYFNSLLIIPEYLLTTLFFFTFGAYFSYNKKNFISYFRKYSFLSAIIYPIVAALDLFTDGMAFNPYIHNLNILIGVFFCFNLVSFFIEKGSIQNNRILSRSSFFIFAMHEPLLSFIRKIMYKILSPSTEFMLLVIYFGGMIFTLCITLFFYYCLKKYFPGFLLFSTGKI
jgi:fucose 4-O-acetylase-like acetyltransferase